MYLWADGVNFNIRLEQDRLCCLVLVGVRADGHKELVAASDGYRESTESWSELLRDLKRRSWHGRFCWTRLANSKHLLSVRCGSLTTTHSHQGRPHP